VSNIEQPTNGSRHIMAVMPCYHFSIQSADGSDREEVGNIALPDDDEARAFGDAMTWDLRDAAQYAGWIMSVADGERMVCDIPFDGSERIPVRLLSSGRVDSDDIKNMATSAMDRRARRSPGRASALR
jgi:hypothetical protein